MCEENKALNDFRNTLGLKEGKVISLMNYGIFNRDLLLYFDFKYIVKEIKIYEK